MSALLRAFAAMPMGEWLAEVETWPGCDRDDALRVRMRWDPLLFYALMFPDLVTLGFNPANRWLARLFAEVPDFDTRFRLRLDLRRDSLEVNRGARKTTLLKLEAVRRLTYGMERAILWGGPEEPAARRETGHLRHLLNSPSDAYLDLFGTPVTRGGDPEFRVWTELGGEGGVMRRGWPGQQTRGANIDGVRPTWIIGDDVEHPKDAQNPRLRDELTAYEDSDVANAGPAFGAWQVFAGTRVHPDGQTARRHRSPAYNSALFRAVGRFPDRSDLWETCRALWADLANERRTEAARAFYEAHRADMDAGAEVLDPEALPIYACMVRLWSIGEREFYRDYQNDPRADGQALLDVDKVRARSVCLWDGQSVRRRTGLDEHGQPVYGPPISWRDCKVAVWLDPRASDEVARNDYAAIGVVLRDRHGYRYVVEVDMARDKPSEGRARMWRWFETFGPAGVKYAYEDNGSQTLHGEGFERERNERKAAGRAWALFPTGYTSSENKMDRIGRWQPDAEVHGWVQFAASLPEEFWAQLRDLRPGAESHDDGPDAAERADWLLAQDQERVATMGANPFRR